jgi:anti-anti-sigma factor
VATGATVRRVMDSCAGTGPQGGGFLRLSGDLTGVTVPHIETEAIRAAQTAEHDVTVDVSDLTFIDSAGLGLLADLLAIGTARGRSVVLLGASAELHKRLLVDGLESMFSYR